eukprot:gene8635-6066_t
MPSRAVLRKKARREAKRSKNPAPKEGTTTKPSPKVSAPASTLATPPAAAKQSDAKALPRQLPTPRKRERDTADAAALAALPRKERHRLETARRLEREVERLQAVAQRSADAGAAPPVERHDPRFTNGTFWRNRKERRARTLFLGGIPAVGYSKAQIEELITSTLQKDPAAAPYLEQLESDVSPLDDIDYLPVKHGAKVRNMYVTLANVGLAGCLSMRLDGTALHGKKLRCNFAADKTQRAEAIRKRGSTKNTLANNSSSPLLGADSTIVPPHRHYRDPYPSFSFHRTAIKDIRGSARVLIVSAGVKQHGPPRTPLSPQYTAVSNPLTKKFAFHTADAEGYRHYERRLGRGRRWCAVVGAIAGKRKDFDAVRAGHAALFGAATGPLLFGYRRLVVQRVFGNLQRAPTPSLLALGVHQLLLTPAVLLAYFNYTTCIRGGFRDRSFMNQHAGGGASRRHTVLSVQRYMLEDVVPFPLLYSWGAAVPLYMAAYLGATTFLSQLLLGDKTVGAPDPSPEGSRRFLWEESPTPLRAFNSGVKGPRGAGSGTKEIKLCSSIQSSTVLLGEPYSLSLSLSTFTSVEQQLRAYRFPFSQLHGRRRIFKRIIATVKRAYLPVWLFLLILPLDHTLPDLLYHYVHTHTYLSLYIYIWCCHCCLLLFLIQTTFDLIYLFIRLTPRVLCRSNLHSNSSQQTHTKHGVARAPRHLIRQKYIPLTFLRALRRPPSAMLTPESFEGFNWAARALSPRFAAALEQQRRHFSPKESIAAYEGFGSFHSENVEVLIAQPEETYQSPTLPLAARRVLCRSELQRLAPLREAVEAAQGAGDGAPLKLPRVEGARGQSDAPAEAYAAALERILAVPQAVCPLGAVMRREHFVIADDLVFINHGGFGSALLGALEVKRQLERHMENEVVEFVDRELLPWIVYSIRRLSRFFDADCRDVVLVQNATFALNSAMKVISQGDVVAYLDTEYLAVYKIVWYRCKEVGASLHEIALSKYLQDEKVMGDDAALTSVISSQLPPGCTTLVLDHITSTSAQCLPVFSHIIPAARRLGVKKIIVDGAHAPLQLDLRFRSLPTESQPTAYVGNLHKWFSSPKAAGFLWVRREDAESISSAVLSHGAGDGLLSEFVWDGTKDYGAYLTIPAIIDFWEAQDLRRVRRYCSTLLQSAAAMLTSAFGSRPVPRGSPFMTLVELPETLQGDRVTAKHIQDVLHDDFGIEVPVKRVEGRYYLRISAFVYNTPDEYLYLRDAVLAAAEQWKRTQTAMPTPGTPDSGSDSSIDSTAPTVHGSMKHNGCGVSGLEPKRKNSTQLQQVGALGHVWSCGKSQSAWDLPEEFVAGSDSHTVISIVIIIAIRLLFYFNTDVALLLLCLLPKAVSAPSPSGGKGKGKRSAGKGAPAGEKKKRRSHHKKQQRWDIYIHRALRNSDTSSKRATLSKAAVRVLSSFVEDMFNRIQSEAVHVAHINHMRTLTATEIQTSVRLLLPTELSKHAMNEGTQAVAAYNKSREEHFEHQHQYGRYKNRGGEAGHLLLPFLFTHILFLLLYMPSSHLLRWFFLYPDPSPCRADTQSKMPTINRLILGQKPPLEGATSLDMPACLLVLCKLHSVPPSLSLSLSSQSALFPVASAKHSQAKSQGGGTSDPESGHPSTPLAAWTPATALTGGRISLGPREAILQECVDKAKRRRNNTREAYGSLTRRNFLCFKLVLSPDHSNWFIVTLVTSVIVAANLMVSWSIMQPAEAVIGIGFVIAAYVQSFLVTATDPGVYPRRLPGEPDPLDHPMIDVSYCRMCNLKRVPQVSHCRVCNVCVLSHDHHCSILGGCVGQRSLRWFVGYLLCITAALMVGIFWIVKRLFTTFGPLAHPGRRRATLTSSTTTIKPGEEMKEVTNWVRHSRSPRTDVDLIYIPALFVLIVDAIVLMLVGSFALMYVYFFFTSLTRRESRKSDELRRSWRRLLSCHSLVQTFVDNLCPPPSLLTENTLTDEKGPLHPDRTRHCCDTAGGPPGEFDNHNAKKANLDSRSNKQVFFCPFLETGISLRQEPAPADPGNFDIASQASSRRSRASGAGGDIANSSKQLVFSEPSATRWLTRVFPIFPVLMPLKSASLQLLSLLGLFLFVMQHWGFILNPHFSAQWGTILGNQICLMFYGFQLTVYDPLLVPSATPTVILVLDYLLLAVGIALIGCILLHLRAKDEAAMEAKTPSSTVARMILNVASGPLLLPIMMLSFSSTVCNANGSMWIYPGMNSGKCWGSHHVAAFVPGILNLLMYCPLSYIKNVCVYEYFPLSDNFLARRHSFLDKICFFSDFLNCFLFAICLAFNVPAAFAALHCILSAIQVFLYMFLLPYFNMGVNRFFVFVHSMEAIGSLFVAVSLANYSFNSSEVTSVLFLGFGLLMAVCLVLLTDYRVNPIFIIELQKAASCVDLAAQQAQNAPRVDTNLDEDDEEDDLAAFNVNDEEVRRLPYPKGLATSMDFSPNPALNAQVVESIAREALNAHTQLGGDGDRDKKRYAYAILVPYICHCYTCFDPCLAAGYLDIYARRFGIQQVTEMMLLFAANIYGRAQCTFIREPYVLLAFISFITSYIPGLRFMGVDLLKLALHNRCSIEEQFRALKQANDLRASLGIRSHAHTIRSTKARATHGKILQLMNRFWVKLTEPSVNIKEVADVADSIRSHRRSAIDQFDAALMQQQSVDPLLLRRLGDFFSQVLMSPDAAQECYSEAHDIYEQRQARSMKGPRQHTAEVDVASTTERMRQLLHFHSVGGGLLSSKASASSIIQVFSIILVVLFGLLAVACALQVYLVSTMSNSINHILLNIYYTTALWTSSLRLSGSVLSLNWDGAQASFNELLVERLRTLISQFLEGFKYITSYGSKSKANQAKTHLMTMFTIPYYNRMADNTAGFSLWGLSESFLQAIDRYINESNPISGITSTNFNQLYVIDSAGVLANGYERYLGIETNDKMDSISTVWMSLFLVIFIVNALLLAVAYASIIFVFERTSLGRVFTFQLFTLIPYDSLEKLATEAKERYHQIHMEKSLGRNASASAAMATTSKEVVRHDDTRKESLDNKAQPLVPYLGMREEKLVPCLKKPDASQPPSSRKGEKKTRSVTFNPVVEVVRSSSDKDRKGDKKGEKQSEQNAAHAVDTAKTKTKKKAERVRPEEDSSMAIKLVVALFAVSLICLLITVITLGFSISGSTAYRRNMDTFMYFQELLNKCILGVPESVQAAVRFMVTGSPVFFQESQDYMIDVVNSIPLLMGVNVPLTSTPLLVYMHKIAKEMDNATLDACALASYTYGTSLAHWGDSMSRSRLTEEELAAEFKIKYAQEYETTLKIAAVAKTLFPENLLFSLVILMKNTMEPILEFFERLIVVYGELSEYQERLVEVSRPLFIVALCSSCVGAAFPLILMFTPLKGKMRKYVSIEHALLVFLSFAGVMSICIVLLVQGKAIDTKYTPNANALLTLSSFMWQTLSNNLLLQGFVLCASPFFWFAANANSPYKASKIISEFIINNYLTEDVVQLFQSSGSLLWDLEVMGNVSAALAVSSLDSAMVVEAPMSEALKYAHWDISAQPNHEYNQVWNREEHYYTTNTADLAKPKDEQFQIAFTVATGSEFYTTFRELVETWRRLQETFVDGERDATSRSVRHRDTLIYIGLGLCALPMMALIFTGTRLGKVLNESFNTNAGSRNTSTDHFKYQSMLRRGLYALMMLSVFYAATFAMGMWVTQTGYAFCNQLILAARREADTALTIFNIRKVISEDLTFTTTRSITQRDEEIYSLLAEQFMGMNDKGVPIGLLASIELDELTFGHTDQTYMTRLMNSFFMDKCSRNIMGTGPLGNTTNYVQVDDLTTTVGGALTDWVAYMSRSIAVTDNTVSTMEDLSAVMAPLADLGYKLLSANQNSTTILLNAFTQRNEMYSDIIMALAIIALVMTVIVFFAVGVPTIYRLFDEEGAVRTLLQIIPPNIRDEVPAIQQHVETGQISGSSELHRKFEQNEKLLQNILPQKIANRLKSGEQPIADTHECVTILFTDFVGFTKRSSSMQAREIVDFLNEVFLEFDTVVELLALEKIKTIGDAFFMAGGLDPHVTDHALRVVEAGLMFFDALDEHNKRHPDRVPLQMRLGVHSGPVVAGVIGIKKVAYDLWGDSVEIANAMESTGVPGYVHISETTASFVQGLFRLQPRGELPREKEHIPENMPKTFLVVGRELPTPYMHLRRPRLMPTNIGTDTKPCSLLFVLLLLISHVYYYHYHYFFQCMHYVSAAEMRRSAHQSLPLFSGAYLSTPLFFVNQK